MRYAVLADLVVVVHLGFILFVVLGAALAARWPRIALLHVPSVVWAALIELCGWTCPLTPLENRLRGAAGTARYERGFVEHYVVPIVYPGSLTRGMQLGLGVSVVVWNVALYTGLYRRAIRRLRPRGKMSSVAGSCLCGSVRFEVGLPTLFCAHCHCSPCRRSHGAGFVTWFAVPRARLRLIEGEALLTRYRSSDHGTRSFCRRCGSSLFFESTRYPERVDVALASMEGKIDRDPQLHVHFDDRVAWISLADSLPRLGGPSGLEPRGDAPDRAP